MIIGWNSILLKETKMVKEITCPGTDFTGYVQDTSKQEFFNKVNSFPTDETIVQRFKRLKPGLSTKNLDNLLRLIKQTDPNYNSVNEILAYSDSFHDIDEARMDIEAARLEIVANLRAHINGDYREGIPIGEFEPGTLGAMLTDVSGENLDELRKYQGFGCVHCFIDYRTWLHNYTILTLGQDITEEKYMATLETLDDAHLGLISCPDKEQRPNKPR